MSKLQWKIVANSLSMIVAIMFIATVCVVYIQPQVVNKLGNYSTKVYKLSYSSETKNVLGQLAQGKTGDVVKLLQSQKWRNVLLDDKPYYLKREILRSLCRVFHATKNYNELLKWVSVWREIDERDVDAMAFWYEALSHTADRSQEGIEGLYGGQKMYPTNVLFQSFYHQSLKKFGDVDNDTILHKQKLIVQNAMKGWELRWRWKLRHAALEPIAELRQQLVKQNWGQVWNVLRRITRLLSLWMNDESVEEKGYLTFSVFPDKDNWIHLSAEIPRQMSTLRIDFPPFSNVTVSELNLMIDGVQRSVSDDLFEYANVISEQDAIKSTGFEDPRFQLNISSLSGFGGGQVMKVEFRFKLLLSDLYGNSKLLSYETALNSLAKID